MDKLRKVVTDDKVKGAIAIGAAALMYFTPDNVDKIVEGLLTAFGLSSFIIKK